MQPATRIGSGGCKGWRLPSIEELASLVDPSQSPPVLPSGHPFDLANVPVRRGGSLVFWSATSTGHGAAAFIVVFSDGAVAAIGKPATAPAWCVRGPGGIFEGQ